MSILSFEGLSSSNILTQIEYSQLSSTELAPTVSTSNKTLKSKSKNLYFRALNPCVLGLVLGLYFILISTSYINYYCKIIEN